ncbi:hypothetical protein K402DRAFT_466326 [Aulographum hederae CBS 113979]|uniref:Uncharacterized protein n=1 Tax=Aulographum hederae CBS 113979 TaxID=1176131 RepID=A0A6G1GQS6_9PEZI|nr:hypothetical protein K402DRAFT_466326 [Aulographum hederae CBS 113979]
MSVVLEIIDFTRCAAAAAFPFVFGPRCPDDLNIKPTTYLTGFLLGVVACLFLLRRHNWQEWPSFQKPHQTAHSERSEAGVGSSEARLESSEAGVGSSVARLESSDDALVKSPEAHLKGPGVRVESPKARFESLEAQVDDIQAISKQLWCRSDELMIRRRSPRIYNEFADYGLYMEYPLLLDDFDGLISRLPKLGGDFSSFERLMGHESEFEDRFRKLHGRYQTMVALCHESSRAVHDAFAGMRVTPAAETVQQIMG